MQSDLAENKRHLESVSAIVQVSETLITATEALIGRVDSLRSDLVAKLDAQTPSLDETATILKAVLAETKQIPKVLPDTPEQKLIDYTKQFGVLREALDKLSATVKEQKLVAEAPIVNVPAPEVHVDAPDLSPISSGLSGVQKAVESVQLGQVVDGALRTRQQNGLLNFEFDEYRITYDSFSDSPEPRIETITYFLKSKKVGQVSYKYDSNGNVTKAKRS